MKYKSIDRDILVVIALTIIAVALAFVLPPDWVPGRIVILPLVLVLPGYALMSALFPRREFGIPERLVFSLALSLVIAVLGGLLLNLTPWGLRAGPWAVLLGGITLGACAATFVRRRGQAISNSGWLRAGNIGLNFRQGLLLGLAGLIVCGAVAVSIIGAERQPYPGFTQLWILPAGGANPKNAVRLGVSNMESTAMQYRLAVSVDGKVVKEWPSIDLNPHEKWEATLLLPQTGHAGTAKVEAGLYRTDAPATIYRDVVLWLGT
jgi:uncharacterized membrane protein